MPDTEYVVLAFGIDGNMPTTDLYQVRFTSEAAVMGTTQITDIKLVKLFDKEEIVALDPSYRRKLGDCECVAIVEATTNEPCDKLYFWWYEEWMKSGYTEEAFLEDLLMYPYANNPEIMDMYYSMDDGDLFFFGGIAEDKDRLFHARAAKLQGFIHLCHGKIIRLFLKNGRHHSGTVPISIRLDHQHQLHVMRQFFLYKIDIVRHGIEIDLGIHSLIIHRRHSVAIKKSAKSASCKRFKSVGALPPTGMPST